MATIKITVYQDRLPLKELERANLGSEVIQMNKELERIWLIRSQNDLNMKEGGLDEAELEMPKFNLSNTYRDIIV